MSTRRRAKVVLTPMALDERQRTRQGIQWLLKAAEKGRKGGIPREQRIAKEVFAVLEGTSEVFKWIEERHKVATANRYVPFSSNFCSTGCGFTACWYSQNMRKMDGDLALGCEAYTGTNGRGEDEDCVLSASRCRSREAVRRA